MTTTLAITQRSPVLNGQAFGATGAYEKVVGTLQFAVDPGHALNRRVTDIERAPRNARGEVAFAADFYLLKPVDIGKAAEAAWGKTIQRLATITIPTCSGSA